MYNIYCSLYKKKNDELKNHGVKYNFFFLHKIVASVFFIIFLFFMYYIIHKKN